MRCITVVLFALVMLAGPSAHAQGPADVATARALFKEGSELSREGKWNEAVDRFTRSLVLKRAALTLYSLGVAQTSLGLSAEALESFRAFLNEPSTRATLPYEQPAREAIAELEKRVAYVRIHVEPPDVQNLVVTLDGIVVPSVALDHPRMVNPGTHAIHVTADGHDSANREMELAEGANEELSITLAPIAPRVAPRPRPPPPTSDRASDRPFPVVPVVLMATSAAVLAVGIGVGLAGVAEVPDTGSPDDPAVDAAREKAIAGDVLAGVGGVTAAVGLVWLIVELTGNDTGRERAGLPTLTDVWRF